MNPFQQMILQISVGTDTTEYLVEDCTLSHTVDTTKDIHLRIELPYNVLPATPQRVNLYLLDIICVFLQISNIYIAKIRLLFQ